MALIHWWKLDETSGPLADSGSPGGYPGTASGTVSVPGLFNRAQEFTTGDYIDCGSPADMSFGSNPFTIGQWFYTSEASTPTIRTFISRYDTSGSNRGFFFCLYSGSLLEFCASSDGTAVTEMRTSFAIPEPGLHFAVVTRSGTTYKLFLDGVLIHTATGPASIYASTKKVIIGAFDDAGSRYSFVGWLDNTQVWNSALTDDEVRDLYYATLPEPITLTNQDPAAYSRRNPETTDILFSIECDIDIKSDFIIEIDETGTGIWATAYNGTSWVSPYTGAIGGTATKIDVTIDERTYPLNSYVYLRVTAENVNDEVYVNQYWFKTHLLGYRITPVYPVDDEQMVPKSTELAIDFRDEDPLTVTVSGTLAYDDSLSPKFRNGWSGNYLDDEQGKRLVLIPPSEFTINTTQTVVVTTASSSLTYTFRIGSQQVTTTNDALVPRLTEASTKTWLGYVRNGKLYLRHIDPLTGAVEMIPAEHFEHGYDPTLGKYILYWVDRGKIYYATADPTDTPTGLVQPNDAYAEVRLSVGSDKPRRLEWEQELLQAPYVRGVPPDGQLIVDVYRPTGDPETTAIVAVHFYKFIAGTFAKIAEVPVVAGQQVISFEDPTYTPGAEYAAVPVYLIGQNTIEGPVSPRGTMPDYSGTVSVGVGSDAAPRFASTYFAPAVYFFPDDLKVAPGSDAAPTFTVRLFTVEIIPIVGTETLEVAAGSDRPGVIKGTGFGIIGVG